MPPIGPLLNALNLSGSVVAMAVATAGWKVHIKKRVNKLRKYLRTGKKSSGGACFSLGRRKKSPPFRGFLENFLGPSLKRT
ncbi:hypothetical protein NI17_015710 [Thermobifida halotolerans]|uniref:Uncharacterized protein n=1 Tax=Thermobifida halotolerans TaxID=483545 RepID=A0AA97M2T0_9ACTN|nr:hypothetical protein [Thermobifida halotolerans]UOE18280.1 hypothetical protein NI17_015710 [Thermobifida halotolerans]